MKRLSLRYLLSVVIGLGVVGGFSKSIEAKGIDADDSVVISGGGGIYYPFDGKSGFNAVVQAAGKHFSSGAPRC